MSHHESFVQNTWTELLRRDDLKDGYIYFHEGGYDFVGRIEGWIHNPDNVIFHLACCARHTRMGWTRRRREFVTCLKIRLNPYPPEGPVQFGDYRICFKGHHSFDESKIIAPVTREERRAAKLRKESGEDPGPLFTAARK